MQVQYRATQAEINLDHLRDNCQAFRRALPEGMRLLACVKADAYGHGAVETARELERAGADYLSVAFLDEAIQLRRAGIQAPVLVLGYTPPEGIRAAWEHRITVTAFSPEVLEAIRNLPEESLKQPLKVHIKIDSGMGRLGLLPGDAAVSFVEKALETPQAEVEGLFTHFSKADEEDKSYTHEQYRRFASVVSALEQKGIRLPILHTGNSATAIDMPELSFNMVRIGISMYGLYPSDEVNRQRIALKPVLTLKTKAAFVKKLPPHWGVSYGARYVTEAEEMIATLPIGYADGYSRMLSGKAEVLIRGRRVPVVGTICMDQCMVSLRSFGKEAEGIQAGEEVVLIGSQSGSSITADELASWLGTINYEVVCMIAGRVPRLYVRSGHPVRLVNSLLPDFEEKTG
ncbi:MULTISPECIES: alanine racemase [Paenibacillus]|uniref:Alanine racemase n=1 Tax=Paenibacillus albilobatus TaxID=2716884 RepID=A0A919XFZ1_9BACL|nr:MULTISPECIES: alanine racemase [Paenibacillus]GIO31894.1 alanine racemase [Paenibacillus albilobatus]